MDVNRAICVFCQQIGVSAPPPPQPQPQAAPAITHSKRQPSLEERIHAIIALLIPIVGIIRGIKFAFDPDPERKRLAGVNFSAALFSMIASFALITWGVPLLYGRGGTSYQEGLTAMQQDHFTLAEQKFQEAVQKDDHFAAAWVNLSAVQLKQGNTVGAETSARRAIQLIESGSYGISPGGESTMTLKAMAYGNLSFALARQFRLAESAQAAQVSLSADSTISSSPNLQRIVELANQSRQQ